MEKCEFCGGNARLEDEADLRTTLHRCYRCENCNGSLYVVYDYDIGDYTIYRWKVSE